MITLTEHVNDALQHTGLDIVKDKEVICNHLLHRSNTKDIIHFQLSFNEAVCIINWFGESYVVDHEIYNSGDERIYFKVSEPNMYFTIYHSNNKDYWSVVPVFNKNIERWLNSIKPCPFCGGKGILQDAETGVWGTVWVSCEQCGVEGAYVEIFNGGTNDMVIDKWNMRA